MTTAALRSKVQKYIEEADADVLKVIYELLEGFRQSNSTLLTTEQQDEVLRRSEMYKAGKIKGYSIAEARQQLKEKTSS
jgi:hypothetical protein